MPVAAKDVRDQTFVGCYAPSELVRALQESAREQDRSVSAEIRRAIREHVERAAAEEGQR